MPLVNSLEPKRSQQMFKSWRPHFTTQRKATRRRYIFHLFISLFTHRDDQRCRQLLWLYGVGRYDDLNRKSGKRWWWPTIIYVGIRFEEPRKITRNISHVNWFRCQNVNRGSPDIMTRVTAQGKTLSINPLNTKRRLLYLKTQFVSRSKHFSSRL